MRLKPLTRLVAGAFIALSPNTQAAPIGPSTSVPPVMIGKNGWVLTSILSVGEWVNLKPDGLTPYRMVGIPDGLGAYDNGDGTFTVLIGHELRPDQGIARAHNITGGQGAFVSKWTIRKSDLKVLHGEDLIKTVYLWDDVNKKFTPSLDTSFNRFCSADLPPISAFYNSMTGKGYNGLIFMNGEEAGDEGRAFAHIVSGGDRGTTYELAYLGKFSWENSVASPYMQDKTIVMGLDDDGLTDSQLFMYVGEKKYTGNAVMQAGLVGGKTYGLKVDGAPQNEHATTGFGGSRFTFRMVDLGYISGKTGAQLEADAIAAGVSNFRRIEDGVWNPVQPNEFFFVTTANFNTPSRLWKLSFSDITNPELGGTIEMLIDGGGLDMDGNPVTVRMLDNMTISADGQWILLQEDPGNQDYLAKIWAYNLDSKRLMEVAEFDPDLFTPGMPNFLTRDEESSGIIDVTHLFSDVAGYDTSKFRYYLLDAQVHRHLGGELVEDGQLMLLAQPLPEPETYTMILAGLGLIGLMARRRKPAPDRGPENEG